MPTNLRLNALVSDQNASTNFDTTEKAIMSATVESPDATTDSVVILATVYNLAED